MIGMVGPTGAGKSTLDQFKFAVFRRRGRGHLVDVVDIRSYRWPSNRKHIGMCQDRFLFSHDAENMAYGRPEAPQAGNVAAAARPALTNSFLQLPTVTILSRRARHRFPAASGSEFRSRGAL